LSIDTIMHDQYFDISGHITKACLLFKLCNSNTSPMKIKRISKQTILRTMITCLILNASLLLSAQTPVSFAGKWEIDHSKSDKEFKDYNITCLIEQTAETMTVTQDFHLNEGQSSGLHPITYNLSGKVVSKEEEGGIDKISAVLSPDKKTLTTKYVRTMNGSDYGSMTVYMLSDDCKTLTVRSSDLKNESPMIQVYNRK
jgi:hypothetical protein